MVLASLSKFLSTSVRTRNTFIEVEDEDRLVNYSSRRAFSSPLLYTDSATELARFLLEGLRANPSLAEAVDITSNPSVVVENFLLTGGDLESGEVKKLVTSRMASRGFDPALILNILVISSTRILIKFVDQPAAMAFKLLFDQSDGNHPTACRVYPADKPKQGRVFVGGIAPQSTDTSLQAYFGRYGQLAEASVILDKRSKLSRGFGFIAFEGGFIPHGLLESVHVVDGKQVGLRLYGSAPQRQRSAKRNSENDSR